MRAFTYVATIGLSWLLAAACWADLIRVKGRETLRGTVIRQTDTEVLVQFEFGTMSFLPGEVEVIEQEEPAPVASDSLPPVIASPTALAESAPTPPPPVVSVPVPLEPAAGGDAEVADVTLRDVIKAVAFIAVLRQDNTIVTGSGTIINEHGVMLTNYHIVDQAQRIAVLLPETQPKGRSKDPKSYEATVHKTDKYYDLAILDIHAETPEFLRFSKEDDIEVGSEVRAVGNPQGLIISVSKGIVSAVRTNRALHLPYQAIPGEFMGEREFDAMTWIQTDAAVNPGNSGGPLLNSRNEIIGINTFIITETGGSVGLNFALHGKHARQFARGHVKPARQAR